ncbi:MAG TPA: nucleotidyltransferase family protein [Thermoguttaceae bacterium]|nr:nucleotidyltransferase family protein [Thermoguttaceae bacterium]
MMAQNIQTKDDVFRTLTEHRRQIEALGVLRIGLFGSFVRDQQRPESDVDLLVHFEPGRKTFDNFMELTFLLEELFSRRVEVVTPEALSPYIGPKILEEVEYVAFAA